jgi:hypothetical protein
MDFYRMLYIFFIICSYVYIYIYKQYYRIMHGQLLQYIIDIIDLRSLYYL